MKTALIGAAWTLWIGISAPAAASDACATNSGDRDPETAESHAWLVDTDGERTRRWVREMDREARAALAGPSREELRERLLAVAGVHRFLPPIERGGRYFYVRGQAGFAQPSIWMQDGLDGEPRELVGADSLAGTGLALHRRIWPSPDGRRLAYAVGRAGSRWLTMNILDLRDGRTRRAVLEGLVAGSSRIAWTPEGDGLLYEQFDLPAVEARQRATLRGERLRLHVPGTAQSTDPTLYAAPDPENDLLTTSLSDDGRFVVVTVRDGRERHHRVVVVDRSSADGSPRTLDQLPEASYGFVGSHEDRIWLQTDHDAPRGRVIAVGPAHPAQWETLIPEQAETIDTWIGASAIGRGLVVGYRRDARLVLDYFDAEGERLRRLTPPGLGSIWTGLYGRQGSSEAFFTVSNFADPGTVFRVDLATGEQQIFRRPELPFDPGDIVVEHRFYDNGQGRRVPLYLAYHRDTPPDGERPMMMYAYGFGGWIPSPWFRAHLPAWFAAGGSFVLPSLRGDGTYGADWHEAGSGIRQGNSIDDFLAAADWLVDEGLVRPRRLVAESNSAGAPVAAMAVLRRPERFGALILAFPLLDLVNYEQYTHATRWRSELGSMDDPEQARVLRRLSPVHNVRSGCCYPPTLLVPGAEDEVTPPMHAYKFAAAMRDARNDARNCDAPVWLRVAWKAGHGYGADAETTAANFADQLLFLDRALGLGR